MNYIISKNREQMQIIPLCLDEMIGPENPCRVIDAFCEILDMKQLGFTHAETAETGRPPYDPRVNLKLYLYGYLNRISSSGMLSRETYRNIEVMWLTGNLHPSKRALCYFKENNAEAIKKVFREFNKIYKELGLFGQDTIAVDSVKIRANNGKKNNHSKNYVAKIMKQIDEKINKYFEMLSESDAKEQNEEPRLPASKIKEIITELEDKKKKYKEIHEEVQESNEKQISTVDEDSRLMKQGSGKGLNVSYNTQVAVEEKNKLVIEYITTNQANDLGRLEEITEAAKNNLGTDKIIVIADSGYHDSTDILNCESKGTTCYVSHGKPPSQQAKEVKYNRENFKYKKAENQYICPEGNVLKFMRYAIKKGKKHKVYANYGACRICPVKDSCTKNKNGREVTRTINQDKMDEIDRRLMTNRNIYIKRLSIVEHPFGTIKWVWGFNRYQTRGLKKVSTENALIFCAYNLRRVMNIIGIKELLEKIRVLFYFSLSSSNQKVRFVKESLGLLEYSLVRAI